MRAPVPVSNLASFSLLRKPPPSFRTEQDDFFFPFHSCERIGLRREESLFLFCSGELVSPSYSLASRHSPLLPVSSRAERGICFSLPRPTWREESRLALSPAAIDETPTQPKLDRLPFRPLRAGGPHAGFACGAFDFCTHFHNSFESHPSRKPLESGNLHPPVSRNPQSFERYQ